ncbi:hypothetical protein [Leisingera caerulea]|uniref:hypothetical protein n=1 Tax=Leisingera caerulea TaxID=506591 RepID=UPI0012B57C8E|nr:hypothetical protein [Leisingera caerulea]
MSEKENCSEAAGRINLSLPVALASALVAFGDQDRLDEAVRSLLEGPAHKVPPDKVGDPIVPDEEPITIDVPPEPPKEPVRELTIEIDELTLRWLREQARQRGVPVEAFVMHVLEDAVGSARVTN